MVRTIQRLIIWNIGHWPLWLELEALEFWCLGFSNMNGQCFLFETQSLQNIKIPIAIMIFKVF